MTRPQPRTGAFQRCGGPGASRADPLLLQEPRRARQLGDHGRAWPCSDSFNLAAAPTTPCFRSFSASLIRPIEEALKSLDKASTQMRWPQLTSSSFTPWKRALHSRRCVSYSLPPWLTPLAGGAGNDLVIDLMKRQSNVVGLENRDVAVVDVNEQLDGLNLALAVKLR